MKRVIAATALVLLAAPAEAGRRPLEQILTKKVSRTYQSAHSVSALQGCLEKQLAHVKLPTSLMTSNTTFDNTRIERSGSTTHVSFDPNFGNSDSDKNRRWMFTASLTPSAGGTQVDIRQLGRSFNHWRQRVESCVHSTSPDMAKAATAPVGMPAATLPNIADEIEKLAKLRDRGVLTQEEFQARKAALLKANN